MSQLRSRMDYYDLFLDEYEWNVFKYGKVNACTCIKSINDSELISSSVTISNISIINATAEIHKLIMAIDILPKHNFNSPKTEISASYIKIFETASETIEEMNKIWAAFGRSISPLATYNLPHLFNIVMFGAATIALDFKLTKDTRIYEKVCITSVSRVSAEIFQEYKKFGKLKYSTKALSIVDGSTELTKSLITICQFLLNSKINTDSSLGANIMGCVDFLALIFFFSNKSKNFSKHFKTIKKSVLNFLNDAMTLSFATFEEFCKSIDASNSVSSALMQNQALIKQKLHILSIKVDQLRSARINSSLRVGGRNFNFYKHQYTSILILELYRCKFGIIQFLVLLKSEKINLDSFSTEQMKHFVEVIAAYRMIEGFLIESSTILDRRLQSLILNCLKNLTAQISKIKNSKYEEIKKFNHTIGKMINLDSTKINLYPKNIESISIKILDMMENKSLRKIIGETCENILTYINEYYQFLNIKWFYRNTLKTLLTYPIEEKPPNTCYFGKIISKYLVICHDYSDLTTFQNIFGIINSAIIVANRSHIQYSNFLFSVQAELFESICPNLAEYLYRGYKEIVAINHLKKISRLDTTKISKPDMLKTPINFETWNVGSRNSLKNIGYGIQSAIIDFFIEDLENIKQYLVTNGLRSLPYFLNFIEVLIETHRSLAELVPLEKFNRIIEIFGTKGDTLSNLISNVLGEMISTLSYDHAKCAFVLLYEGTDLTKVIQDNIVEGKKLKIIPQHFTYKNLFNCFNVSQPLHYIHWGSDFINNTINKVIQNKYYPARKIEIPFELVKSILNILDDCSLQKLLLSIQNYGLYCINLTITNYMLTMYDEERIFTSKYPFLGEASHGYFEDLNKRWKSFETASKDSLIYYSGRYYMKTFGNIISLLYVIDRAYLENVQEKYSTLQNLAKIDEGMENFDTLTNGILQLHEDIILEDLESACVRFELNPNSGRFLRNVSSLKDKMDGNEKLVYSYFKEEFLAKSTVDVSILKSFLLNLVNQLNSNEEWQILNENLPVGKISEDVALQHAQNFTCNFCDQLLLHACFDGKNLIKELCDTVVGITTVLLISNQKHSFYSLSYILASQDYCKKPEPKEVNLLYGKAKLIESIMKDTNRMVIKKIEDAEFQLRAVVDEFVPVIEPIDSNDFYLFN